MFLTKKENTFIPQRRVLSPFGSPWLEWLSFPWFTGLGFLPPYEPWPLFGGRNGVAYFGRGEFWLKIWHFSHPLWVPWVSGSQFLCLLILDFYTLRTLTFIWWAGGCGVFWLKFWLSTLGSCFLTVWASFLVFFKVVWELLRKFGHRF